MTVTVRYAICPVYGPVYIADGPDGHLSMLARATPEDAQRDGEAYLARTRELVDGKWRVRQPSGNSG